jgi:UDP-N-acetylmuramyl tripeptide synthase
MSIRRLLAIWSAKIVNIICKITGKKGETLPGVIAIKIYPSILSELAKEVREKIYVVCGTNGKTTTNNLLSEALLGMNKKVIFNTSGSNMLNGVISAFVIGARLNGHLDADYACIEVDEASTVNVFPYFTPDYMILTNLFRDQLDRYGEIDTITDFILKALSMDKRIKLIVNGDDSLSNGLAIKSGHEYISFGVGENVINDKDKEKEVKEGSFCPLCGSKLEYEYYHYSQLGKYDCLSCTFTRPNIKYEAKNIDLENKIAFDVGETRIEVNYRGFYNIYNILAAYSAYNIENLPIENFKKMLSNYNPQNGRMEEFIIDGKRLILNLAKNPSGFNQNISAVLNDKEEKDIIIMINDNWQDGIDISWLWDVDFERFQDDTIKSITVTGIRKLDMLIRLKYVDIPAELENNVEDAIKNILEKGTGNIYILVNYTALFSTRAILEKMQK